MERLNRPEVVVVTGASAGVGRAVAREFGKQGAKVGLLARGRDGLEAARAEIEALGGEALVLPADVANAEQVEQVLFAKSGAAETLSPGAVVIMSVTMTPAQMASFAERLDARSWPMLDAPMSGGAAAAEQGQLSFMAAGSDEAFAKAEPLLQPMAKRVYRLGAACGMGSTMTSQDVVNGEMAVQVLVAMIQPAEFLVMTFRQQTA